MRRLLARVIAHLEHHHRDATVRWTTQQPKQAVIARRKQ